MAGSDTWLNQLERWIAPWKRRILSMVGKCILSSISDDGNLQMVELKYLTDEVIAGVERVQEFGFTSVPPVNSEGIVLFLGGNQQHGVVIATDNSTYRLKGLPDGSTAIYNKNGDFVKLTDSKIEVHAAEVTIGDGTSFKKLMTQEMIDLYNNHTHLVAAVPSTGTPPPTIPTLGPIAPLVENVHTTIKTKAE